MTSKARSPIVNLAEIAAGAAADASIEADAAAEDPIATREAAEDNGGRAQRPAFSPKEFSR
jgi:hypothetical protein